MDDMTESIAPKSDQMNAEDLLGGPRTFTITEVRVNTSPDQPVHVYLAEFPPDRPFKPSKTVRRLMVVAWGADSAAYAGKRITLYRDPAVRFGGQDVGGIRVSHMSGLDGPLNVALAVTRGRRAPYTVDPLPDGPAPGGQRAASLPVRAARMVDGFAALGVTEDDLDRRIGRPRAGWAEDDLDRMVEVFVAMQRGETTRDVAFPRPEVTADDLPPDPIKDPPVTLPDDPNPVTLPASGDGDRINQTAESVPESTPADPSITALLDRLRVTDPGDASALMSLYLGRPVQPGESIAGAEYETVLAALATIAGQDDEARAADLARDLAEARELAGQRDPQ